MILSLPFCLIFSPFMVRLTANSGGWLLKKPKAESLKLKAWRLIAIIILCKELFFPIPP